MFFFKNIKLIIIILIVFGLFTAPALAVQKGKEYGNLSFPRIVRVGPEFFGTERRRGF